MNDATGSLRGTVKTETELRGSVVQEAQPWLGCGCGSVACGVSKFCVLRTGRLSFKGNHKVVRGGAA